MMRVGKLRRNTHNTTHTLATYTHTQFSHRLRMTQRIVVNNFHLLENCGFTRFTSTKKKQLVLKRDVTVRREKERGKKRWHTLISLSMSFLSFFKLRAISRSRAAASGSSGAEAHKPMVQKLSRLSSVRYGRSVRFGPCCPVAIFSTRNK